MVLTCVFDFQGREKSAVWLPAPEPAETNAEYLVVNWADPAREAALTALAARWGPRLLVPEIWRQVLPQAGLLVSSAISGGELKQRFLDVPSRRCWLLEEPMCMTFPLPCPTGQGIPASEMPKNAGFYSPALGCRYTHRPGQVLLFDTEETMARKRRLAEQCGFLGYLRLPE